MTVPNDDSLQGKEAEAAADGDGAQKRPLEDAPVSADVTALEPSSKRPRSDQAAGDVPAGDDPDGNGNPQQKEIPLQPASPVKLGPMKFDFSDDAVTYFSKLLNAQTPRQNINEYERMVLQALIENGHPSYQEKAGESGVKHFLVDNHPEHPSKCFWLVRPDGSREDFSYRKCVLSLWPEANFSSAGGGERRFSGGGDRRHGGGRGRHGGGGGRGRGRFNHGRDRRR
ncbi:hypothetical protein RI054_26g109190 [Pseudoscourfieldia marina]